VYDDPATFHPKNRMKLELETWQREIFNNVCFVYIDSQDVCFACDDPVTSHPLNRKEPTILMELVEGTIPLNPNEVFVNSLDATDFKALPPVEWTWLDVNVKSLTTRLSSLIVLLYFPLFYWSVANGLGLSCWKVISAS
jgi:hypothetical protein